MAAEASRVSSPMKAAAADPGRAATRVTRLQGRKGEWIRAVEAEEVSGGGAWRRWRRVRASTLLRGSAGTKRAARGYGSSRPGRSSSQPALGVPGGADSRRRRGVRCWTYPVPHPRRSLPAPPPPPRFPTHTPINPYTNKPTNHTHALTHTHTCTHTPTHPSSLFFPFAPLPLPPLPYPFPPQIAPPPHLFLFLPVCLSLCLSPYSSLFLSLSHTHTHTHASYLTSYFVVSIPSFSPHHPFIHLPPRSLPPSPPPTLIISLFRPLPVPLSFLPPYIAISREPRITCLFSPQLWCEKLRRPSQGSSTSSRSALPAWSSTASPAPRDPATRRRPESTCPPV